MATQHSFKTEVSELLQLIIHSLYSHKEIFLRELVSNASDALDKLKYLTLTDERLKTLQFSPRIDLGFDEEGRNILTISDNGIGMNADELEENLGTIARSGTRDFLKNLSGDARKDSGLIGQFGVGFYSAFMVADRVEVVSRKAGEEGAFLWESDGKGSYSISEAKRGFQGTTVTLFLNDEGKEYANRWQIEELIKKYSNHISFPIYLTFNETSYEGEKENRKEKKELKTEQVNSASALWKKPKSEIGEDEYKEFYKSISHDSEDPLTWMHTRAEGSLEYTTLFYIPKKAPFDMYQADYRPGVKLYVSRVFITDDSKELMPTYLRFLRGVIDSEDLPLNVSREILQQNRIMNQIRTASVKKVLSELKTLSENDKTKYDEFIAEFNRPLKEGLYSDFGNRETLLELVRYKTTASDGYTSLAEYKERMKSDQKHIYYVTGDNEDTIRNSPLLSAYTAKGFEVLIMDDEIDEIVTPTIGKYKDTELKAINRSGAADELKTEEDKEKEKATEPLLEKVKKALGDKVKKVVASTRLGDSPACIVADENDPTIQLQQMLKAMGQKDIPAFTPVLEVNPDHPIVKRIGLNDNQELISDLSNYLLEQALIMEGVELKKPAEFVKRISRLIAG
jgi:molecular chaperone HtpG